MLTYIVNNYNMYDLKKAVGDKLYEHITQETCHQKGDNYAIFTLPIQQPGSPKLLTRNNLIILSNTCV